MTTRDFVYWFQGYFEIAGIDGTAALSAVQVDIIKRHLALSGKSKVDRARFPDAHVGAEFCYFLDNLLFRCDCSNGLSDEIVEQIRLQLNATFKHVVDHTFSNRAELLTIHNGDGEEDEGEDDEALC